MNLAFKTESLNYLNNLKSDFTDPFQKQGDKNYLYLPLPCKWTRLFILVIINQQTMKLILNACRNGSCFYRSSLALFRIGPTELTARFETRIEFGP